jgi:cytochrome c oxidase subunit 1
MRREGQIAAGETHAMRGWLALALASLVGAGLFSLAVLLARMPPFDRLVTDPVWFRRALVVHVDLALVVWFAAVLGALFHLVPARGRTGWWTRAGVKVSALGTAVIVAGSLVPGTTPVLANYVPVLDHPVYLVGLGLVALGLVMTLVCRRLLPGHEARAGIDGLPASARTGARAAALLFLIAMVTLVITIVKLPDGLPPANRYELLFWGPGHILQVAHVAGMLTAWSILAGRALGRDVIGRKAAAVLFGLLVLPALAGPMLAGSGPASISTHHGYTQLMRWGIFPVVLVTLGLLVRAIVRARREGTLPAGDRRLLALYASAVLAVLGFVLGALIRGSSTMIPAHYHASIGAVTASYMALVPLLLGAPVRAAVGRRAARLRARVVAWQPAIFGAGQAVFALGFALAGTQGMARKVYGAEQHVRTWLETVGLVVMGVGGLVAVAGGLAFLVIAGAAWRARTPLPLEDPDAASLDPETDGQPLAPAGAGRRHPAAVLHAVGLARAVEHAAGKAAVRGGRP